MSLPRFVVQCPNSTGYSAQQSGKFRLKHNQYQIQAVLFLREIYLYAVINDKTYMISPSNEIYMTPKYSVTQSLQSIDLNDTGSTLVIAADQNTLSLLFQKLCKIFNQKGFNEYYKPLKRLGRGNFASVYLVENRRSKCQYAVKVFAREQQYSEIHGKQALDNEISIMRSLDHNNILKFYGVHYTENLVYVVMEYLSGGTLEDYIRTRMSITGDEIIKIIKEILLALQFLDSKDIMHRDLKPANIMMRKETKEWVLTDFGLSANSNAEYLYQKCGTPGYVAPQILNLENFQQKYTQICDIYSLGIIFYTLLFGKVPFGEAKEQEDLYELNKNGQVVFNSEEIEELHPEIVKLMKRMLETNPSKRIRPSVALKSKVFELEEVNINAKEFIERQRQRIMNKILKFANNRV